MTPRASGMFGPRGHNLNKLDKGPLGDATYQISRLKIGLVVSDKKICFKFLY